MRARPADAGIGIERLTLQLWLPRQRPAVPLGLPATRHWPGGGGFHSSPEGTLPTHFQLRFPMTFDQLRLLEAAAITAAPGELELELRGDVSVGWMDRLGGGMFDPGRGELPPGIQTLGLFSQIQPFWVTGVQSNALRLTREQLAERILPGLGLDRVRLVTVRLPASGGVLPQKIVGEYDAARRDFDAGRYREAIQKCRNVRHTIEKAINASDKDGARVADQLGKFGAASPRTVAAIDLMWKGLAELTSEAHHPEDSSAFTGLSARMTLLATAVLVEAISELLTPRPI